MSAAVEAVKAHAQEHYEDGGWDVIVECWEDAEIAEYVQQQLDAGYIHDLSSSEAIRAFLTIVSIWKDREDDAANSAF
jgi:hypothetical protein